MPNRPVYLDCNATTPIDPRVLDVVIHYMTEEFGNAGSRTHEYGSHAKQAVEKAREQVAAVVKANKDEIIFTSGATESNNLAILGLAPHGEKTGKKHIVSTQIEHKAVLEPLEEMQRRGFEVTLVPPNQGGWVEPDEVLKAIRHDTLFVSVMHVNNETGVIQPIIEIADLLANYEGFLHVDAAQGFGKDIQPLQHTRVDMISVSGHKIYAPKGVGALITRRRSYSRIPLTPLLHGGGQEKGLRPGTLPVPLVAGLGYASAIAMNEAEVRASKATKFRTRMINALRHLDIKIIGDQCRTLPFVINFSFNNLDSEAAMLALRDLVAISNGSACTSSSYTPSHVLKAMGVDKTESASALRWSWSANTAEPNWEEVVRAISRLK